jgi:two-component system cell cycle response regulator DivK
MKDDEGKLILVVEDNLTNLDLLSSLLEVHGFRVLQTTTAAQGIAAAREREPDLILMDVSLPGMNGLEALALLKEDPMTEGIPVVVVTAHALASDRKAAMRAGCAAFMTKPIDTRSLIREISHLLLQEQKTLRVVRDPIGRKSGLYKTRKTGRARKQ